MNSRGWQVARVILGLTSVRAGIGFCALLAAGCGSVPAKRIDTVSVVASSVEIGASYAVTAGEVAIGHYRGAWREVFVTKTTVQFEDLNPIPVGMRFVALYEHEQLDKLFLVSTSYYAGEIALQSDRKGNMSATDRAFQIVGVKEGRNWGLLTEAGQLLQRDGFVLDPVSPAGSTGWKLQYVGAQGSVLRFTIQELGLDQQRMGQVEYSHDLNVGKEFVFRGARLRVDGVDPDSTLRYTVISLPN
jgi:hypothetical protein